MLARALLTIFPALAGCAVSTPWRSTGAVPEPGVPVVISVSRADVKPDRKDAFQAYVDRVLEALPRQPGLVGYSIRREIAGDRVWTLTAWRNEQARAAFVGSPIHAEAMARALPTLRATRFARVERAPGEGPPTWSEALRWLEESGREYSNTAR